MPLREPFTVGQLRAALEGVPDEMPVVINDYREFRWHGARWASRERLSYDPTTGHIASCGGADQTDGECEENCMRFDECEKIECLMIAFKHTTRD